MAWLVGSYGRMLLAYAGYMHRCSELETRKLGKFGYGIQKIDLTWHDLKSHGCVLELWCYSESETYICYTARFLDTVANNYQLHTWAFSSSPVLDVF